jgi:hypothetical protein
MTEVKVRSWTIYESLPGLPHGFSATLLENGVVRIEHIHGGGCVEVTIHSLEELMRTVRRLKWDTEDILT